MTSLFTARRSAEEFATAVDGGPMTHGPRQVATADLLDLVATLRTHDGVAPRAEFASDLRSRLMAEAETVLTAAPHNLTLPVRPRGTRERRLVAAASAFVLIGGSATMAAAAQNALPGETLYPIKRGIEQAEASLHLSPAGKGNDLLEQASDRLSEVEGLVHDMTARSTPQVPETLHDFNSQATEGSDLLFKSYEETRDPSSIATVRSFAADGIAELRQLADVVPPEAQDELAEAAVVLQEIDGQAVTLCNTCASDLPPVEVPGILLAHAEVDRALDNISSLDLNNDHPVEVPKGLIPNPGNVIPDDSGTVDSDGETDPKQPESDENPVPAPSPWSPEELVTPLLPGTGEKSGSKTDDSNDLTNDLSGAVETLLPDSDTNLLP